jgi:hypothetical protein
VDDLDASSGEGFRSRRGGVAGEAANAIVGVLEEARCDGSALVAGYADDDDKFFRSFWGLFCYCFYGFGGSGVDLSVHYCVGCCDFFWACRGIKRVNLIKWRGIYKLHDSQWSNELVFSIPKGQHTSGSGKRWCVFLTCGSRLDAEEAYRREGSEFYLITAWTELSVPSHVRNEGSYCIFKNISQVFQRKELLLRHDLCG